MWALELPITQAEEDKKLASILKSAAHFRPHETVWKKAYANYRAAKGDPWLVSASTFQPSIKAEQLELYTNRKNGGPIKRIRETKGIRCCPVCGSPSIGTLDHYLPKEDYPEFSVLASNLVPACGLCNSGAKGRTVKGSSSPERFIHPYFDRWAEEAVWQVEITPNYAAATFKAVPNPTLTGTAKTTITFHLGHVFGPQFHVQMATYWQELPEAVADHRDFLTDLGQVWSDELKWSARSFGLNGWRTALIRGVIADAAAQSYLEQKALALRSNS